MMDVRAARLEMTRVTCSMRAEMNGRLTRPVSNQQDGGDGRGTRAPPRCQPTCSLARRQRSLDSPESARKTLLRRNHSQPASPMGLIDDNGVRLRFQTPIGKPGPDALGCLPESSKHAGNISARGRFGCWFEAFISITLMTMESVSLLSLRLFQTSHNGCGRDASLERRLKFE